VRDCYQECKRIQLPCLGQHISQRLGANRNIMRCCIRYLCVLQKKRLWYVDNYQAIVIFIIQATIVEKEASWLFVFQIKKSPNKFKIFKAMIGRNPSLCSSNSAPAINCILVGNRGPCVQLYTYIWLY